MFVGPSGGNFWRVFSTPSCMSSDLTRFLSLKTPNTRRAYLTAISHLELYIDSSANFCSQENAIDYISKFRNSHSDSSVKHRYHLLRSYFEYLVNLGIINRNPFRIIPTLMSLRQSNQVRPTKTLSTEQVRKILSKIPRDTKRGRLQFAFISTLFGGGLRRGEALAIRRCNVTVELLNGVCALELRCTKGGRSEFQPIPAWVAEAIQATIEDFKRGPADRIFPFSEKTAWRIVRSRCQDAGIVAAPHAFRAAAATMLKEQGEEDRAVAEFLRHKTTHMVKVYDHRSRNRLSKAKKCLENFLKK